MGGGLYFRFDPGMWNLVKLALSRGFDLWMLALLASTAMGQTAAYDQPYRPQVHFSPREYWTNDPNGLVFFLGQQGRGFGACLLYEYNFEQNLPGDYHHTLTFPPLRLISRQDDERIA